MQTENQEQDRLEAEIENLNKALSVELENLKKTQIDIQAQKELIEKKVQDRKQGRGNHDDNDLDTDFLYLSAFEQSEQAGREIIFDLQKQIKEKETELKNVQAKEVFITEKERIQPRLQELEKARTETYKNLGAFFDSIKNYKLFFHEVKSEIDEINVRLTSMGDYKIIPPNFDSTFAHEHGLLQFLKLKQGEK